MRTAHVLHQPALAGSHPRRRRQPISWLAARLRAPRLDRQIADGVPPWRSPTHAARALQLTSNHHRRDLARGLERLIEDAERTPTPFRGAVIPPCRAQVRHAMPLLLTLASRLRSAEPVNARGIAQLSRLLSDGGGPCYARVHPEALTRALQHVSRWLDIDD